MFTGIVEELGVVGTLERRPAGARLRVRCRAVLEGAELGSSIAVNGACLTVVERKADGFSADVAPETMLRTNLGELKAGALVNLERPLTPASRLDGHIVQGHVDSVGELVSLEPVGEGNWWLKVKAPRELDRYLVFKGSVAIDGMSLTIAAVEGEVISAAIIPHTYQNTNLRTRRRGERLNIECDILAKYVEKLLAGPESPKLTMDRLRELGY
jgi:riboflavin synthase